LPPWDFSLAIRRESRLDVANERCTLSVADVQFPAAGNLTGNFHPRRGDFCELCPKSANFAQGAGNGTGNSGNLPSKPFSEWNLRSLFLQSFDA
jgi:hypothetical protein